ncbi:hypothetical protein L195_g027997 [Trifolium pratense]|uniref:Uncharacterized protein n=1 Tax=Trifolium pratense TaxID=57577 RepID=A0A2K3L0Q8_TRIPR|nr:hypothetical protein L195_g027997 [Trifolium pratense]
MKNMEAQYQGRQTGRAAEPTEAPAERKREEQQFVR